MFPQKRSLQWSRIMTSCTTSNLGKKLWAFVYKSVCLRFPTKWFLLEGRQTAIETVVWHSWKREREREWETEQDREVDGGVVKLTVPPFTQVLPFPPNSAKTSRTSKNAKEQVKPLFPLVVCSPAAKHQDNISLCLSALIDKLAKEPQVGFDWQLFIEHSDNSDVTLTANRAALWVLEWSQWDFYRKCWPYKRRETGNRADATSLEEEKRAEHNVDLRQWATDYD